jgi:hypothetical protein
MAPLEEQSSESNFPSSRTIVLGRTANPSSRLDDARRGRCCGLNIECDPRWDSKESHLEGADSNRKHRKEQSLA